MVAMKDTHALYDEIFIFTLGSTVIILKGNFATLGLCGSAQGEGITPAEDVVFFKLIQVYL